MHPRAWTSKICCCSEKCPESIYPANTTEALKLLNNNLISLINAFDFKTATGVIDGFVLREYGK